MNTTLEIFSLCSFISKLQDSSYLIESIFSLVENVIYFCSGVKLESNYYNIKSYGFCENKHNIGSVWGLAVG